MKRSLASRLALASIALAIIAACTTSGAGEAPPSARVGGGAAPDAAGGDGQGNPGATPGAAIPGEPLPADPLTACPATYRTTAPKAGLVDDFTVAGQKRSFVLLLPAATFTGPRPLFIGFNGTSENGPKFAARAKLAELTAKGFIVVVPSSAGNGSFWPIWDGMRKPGDEGQPNADLELFDALVGCTAAHFSVDRKRIFVGGHSAGGIFTNKVLRARSNVVAGGIVGSGVFSLTQSGSTAPLGPLFVVVTWGGDNDLYRGTTPSGVTVPEFSFVEQASLASKYYEAQPAVTQVQCRGNDLGHAWLPINAWFADTLIAHPKGAAAAALLAVPAGAPVVCREDAYGAPPMPAITCAASATTGCQAACQLMADCVGENRTVGTVMKNQLTSFGFAGTSCGGCLTRCQQSSGASNAAALSCMAEAQATAQCGGGIEGAFPVFGAIEKCCKGRADSSFCVGVCTSINQNEAAAPFFPVCKLIAP